MVQRGGDSGFGGVVLFLMAAGALVWFLQSQTSSGGLALGASLLTRSLLLRDSALQ